jgi:hypothetical protein
MRGRINMAERTDGQLLGRIIGCRGHTRYFFSPADDENSLSSQQIQQSSLRPPLSSPGTFVIVSNCDNMGSGMDHSGRMLLGMIISTSLLSMEGFRAGSGTGPMTGSDIGLFTPEVMNEATKVTEVHGIGTIDADGQPVFGTPECSPSYLDDVRAMSDQEIARLHSRAGKLHLEYFPLLSEGADVQTRFALQNALNRLITIVPEQKIILSLLRTETARMD